MDEDLEDMDRDALIAEVKRLRAGVRAHRDSSGQDLCWHHPQLWGLLPEPIDPEVAVPPWPKFLRGCIAYRQALDRELPTAPVAEVDYEASEVDSPVALIEFPADDPNRARRFWSGLLGIELADRRAAEGSGWQTHAGDPAVGIHERGTGPGDTVSLPYFATGDMDAALDQVKALGGSVIHPGSRWAVCRDSEGSPFGLALNSRSA